MQYTKTTVNQTPLHIIETDKFKNVHIAVRFFDTLDPLKATKRHILASMMRSKTQNHSSRKALSRSLEGLFDTVLNATSNKLGMVHINQFELSFIHPSYADDAHFLNDVLSVLKDVIHAPLLDEKSFKEEKQFLKDFFDAEYSNKTRYASKRYYEYLFEDHPYKVHPFGDETLIDSISLKDIIDEWHHMITSNAALISVTGNIEVEPLKDSLDQMFDLSERALPTRPFIRRQMQVKHPVRETMNVTQARLFMTLSSNIYYTDDDYVPMLVFNALFGDNSEAMLFQTIREKHGLAYYASSAYAPSSGLVTVTSGVDEANVEKTKQLVRDIVSMIQAGTFDQNALMLAKTHLKASLKKSYDAPRTVSNKALRHAIFHVPFEKDALMQAIDNTTKTDIIRVANTLEFIFTYELGRVDNDA